MLRSFDHQFQIFDCGLTCTHVHQSPQQLLGLFLQGLDAVKEAHDVFFDVVFKHVLTYFLGDTFYW